MEFLITALTLVCCLNCFMLGRHLSPKVKKPIQDDAEPSAKAKAEKAKKEVENFFNYEGSEQE